MKKEEKVDNQRTSLEVGRIGAGKGTLFMADVSVMVRPRGRWGYMLVMEVCCDVCAACSCFCFFDGIWSNQTNTLMVCVCRGRRAVLPSRIWIFWWI